MACGADKKLKCVDLSVRAAFEGAGPNAPVDLFKNLHHCYRGVGCNVRNTDYNSIIDSSGKFWPLHSQSLRKSYCATSYQGDFIGDTIRNLGFVAVAKRKGSVRIRLKPSAVMPIAFAELIYWLHDQQPERVLVSSLEGELSHQLFCSAIAAADRLCVLRSRNQSATPDIIAARIPIEQLSTCSSLGRVVNLWRDAGGRLKRDLIETTVGAHVNNRVVIVEPVPGGRLQMTMIGAGMRWPDPVSVAALEGAPIDAHPDLHYRRWVADSYQSVLKTNQPRLEDVDALVGWPHTGKVSRRYRRLILPCQGQNGEQLLIGATCVDAQLNLRVKVA
jgi:hypothetical protein